MVPVDGILTALGFFMWPHAFSAILTSKREQTFRRNAALLPLYQLILLFAFFCGFAAILQVPGLTGAQADQALLRLSVQTFDPWFVGVIGAAGVMTALVPGSIILDLGRDAARQRRAAAAAAGAVGLRGRR